jgi:primosomal protein N' (replication factor Y)
MTARKLGAPHDSSRTTVQVALPLPPRSTFTYLVPEGAPPPPVGSRVRVPFGGRRIIGYVVDDEATTPPEKLKRVEEVLDATPFFPSAVLDLTRWIADYYLVSWGSVLKCAYPSGLDPSPRSTYRIAPGLTGPWPERLRPALDALSEGPRKLSSLRASLGAPAESLLQEAVKEGWALEETQWVSARRHVGADRVALLLSVAEARTKAEAPDQPKAFRKALGALLGYQERGFPTVAQVAQIARVPHFTLTEMAEAGWVELFDLLPAKLPGCASPHVLTESQRSAVAAVAAAMEAKRHETFLLFGVTGSGKTEVYLRLMEKALESGGTCIYLVPEISLASFLARRLIERFGSEVAILHSGMTEHERVRQWLRVARGGARLVIGPRSALFAPLTELALVIVDEEHDGSFKQQDFPRYHARDMAVLLGVQTSAAVVLGSATPSVESFYNATEAGKYTLMTLPERTAGARLPPVEVVDMRAEYQAVGQKTTLSRALHSAIQEALDAERQVVILRNRLGFSTFVLCRGCGHTVQCPECSVALTYHRRVQRLKCHYCGHGEPVPAACPSCGGEFLQFLGEGTEKVEHALSNEFPSARVARMDRDAVRTARDFDRLWRDFEGGKIDVLAGTQMVAKGHDIPNITLAGILSADFILGLPDFRAAERTFQLITQAAGRAGRGGTPGKVILQSFHPDHYAVRASAGHDFVSFYEFDIRYRKMVGYPPVGALARVEFRHQDRSKVGAWGREAGAFLQGITRGRVKVLGPIEPPIARLEGRHRLHLLLKADSRQRLREVLSKLLDGNLSKLAGRHMIVEIDPYSLL